VHAASTSSADIGAQFVLQSVSEQLDALLDRSVWVAPARLQRHKEAAAARDLEHALQVSRLQHDLQRSHAQVRQLQQRHKEAAAARVLKHALQVSRLQGNLERSHVRIHQLQQQLEAAQAQLHRQQQQ
jgi:predicted glycosyl hydrolase (DUF1957 family)